LIAVDIRQQDFLSPGKGKVDVTVLESYITVSQDCGSVFWILHLFNMGRRICIWLLHDIPFIFIYLE